MTNSTELTKLKLTILELIEKGKGQWSWYELAQALSNRDVAREPDLMVVLHQLADENLVKEYVEKGSPRDRWELTSLGFRQLKLLKLQTWAKSQINSIAKQEITDDIPIAILQLIDDFDQLQGHVKELEEKLAHPV
jgi:PadR family transcriptional regulator PadR